MYDINKQTINTLTDIYIYTDIILYSSIMYMYMYIYIYIYTCTYLCIQSASAYSAWPWNILPKGDTTTSTNIEQKWHQHQR